MANPHFTKSPGTKDWRWGRARSKGPASTSSRHGSSVRGCAGSAQVSTCLGVTAQPSQHDFRSVLGQPWPQGSSGVITYRMKADPKASLNQFVILFGERVPV